MKKLTFKAVWRIFLSILAFITFVLATMMFIEYKQGWGYIFIGVGLIFSGMYLITLRKNHN